MPRATLDFADDGLRVELREHGSHAIYHAQGRQIEIAARTYENRPSLRDTVVLDLGPLMIFLSKAQAADLGLVLEAATRSDEAA